MYYILKIYVKNGLKIGIFRLLTS